LYFWELNESIMAWVAVNKNEKEYIFYNKPDKENLDWWIFYKNCFHLPKGSIGKLIGKKLTWYDEPVELK